MSTSSVKTSSFGRLPDGRDTQLFTLTNANGHVVTLTDYGATVVSIFVPDRDGKLADVSLGFESVEGYLNPGNPYFGSAIGRFGNRLAKGRFTLDGKEYSLATNNGENHLHGGLKGFDKLLWSSEIAGEAPASVRFKLTSPDGDEGYPGKLDVTIVYTWTDDSTLEISYEAVTDAPTIINLTNHAYFNLTGDMTQTVEGHVMQIHAEHFTPVSPALIPTGEIKAVAGTQMDFRTAHAIGDHLRAVGDDPKGYDHNYVLATAPFASLQPCAVVVEPGSGRRMTVATTEPAVQFYSGNFLDGTLPGKGGVNYARYSGFCLETQHFPDSPNQPTFPSTVLRPGQTYRTRTTYRFDTV